MNLILYEQAVKLRQSEGFVPHEIVEAIDRFSSKQLDDLHFGVIELSDEGLILQYNRYEQELAGRKIQDVLGLSFFSDVAPCAQKPIFSGLFFFGVQRGQLDCMISYYFDFHMQPTHVWIHMYQNPKTRRNWLFVLRK